MNFEPGTVAVATVDGESSYRVMRIVTDEGLMWAHSATSNDVECSEDSDVTDVRPLIVLDPDDPIVTEFVKFWGPDGDRSFAGRLAQALTAQTKTPRIPEPGLWGVVEAGPGERGRWIKTPRRWLHNNGMRSADWDDLIDPVLVRDGIEDAS